MRPGLLYYWLLVFSAAGVQDPHWAFKAATRPAVPRQAGDWIRNPIDAFILIKLGENGLSPSPQADRRTLARRLYFDLIGLPPTLEAVRQFEIDPDPLAYEKLVDRLLASPQYGERWARHWLDVVHFGESHGYDKDKIRPHAWPYRDYVIRAFNQDKPYSRFIQEQLAGDALSAGEPDSIVALGFIAAGPWDYVGHTELPITKTDGLIARYNDRDDMVMTAMSTFQSLTVHCARCHDHKFDPITQRDYYGLQAIFAGVDRANRPYAVINGKTQFVYAAASEFAPEGSFKPPKGMRPVHFLPRGDVSRAGERMKPAALSHTFDLPENHTEADRRVAFAEWLTASDNMLTRRSIVNRVWQYHFGRGIVDTPNDFGKMGSPPTHPELLDWLAFWFCDHGESIKDLHRLLLTSATYRQSSAHNPGHVKIDADNRFLWRMNRTRLDAEVVRDSMLFVAGNLDLAMGGPSIRNFYFKDDHSPVYDYSRGQMDSRRSIYRHIVRSVPDPFMDCLDAADPNILTARRNTTLTALQALATLNNPFVIRQSEIFAARAKEVRTAFALALSRRPTGTELATLNDYTHKHGLTNTCRLLFNTTEFMFAD
ncbi:MAG TPA: DUF1549 and DUF1553 domain-containing protein [Verrucomicrobiae bacterium]|nr:DUF1549 and DUF1553 domain-containing protein [Verrucomicrobiae bacterium]